MYLYKDFKGSFNSACYFIIVNVVEIIRLWLHCMETYVIMEYVIILLMLYLTFLAQHMKQFLAP